MKLWKLLIITLLLGALFLAPLKPALAVDEAGGAATLSSRLVITDNRAETLQKFLESYNSPLASEADHFVAEADRLNLDWKLVAAISGTESTFGKVIPYGSYNAWGWGIPTGADWGLAFIDWKSAITAVSEGLRYNYLDKGALTVEQIGRIYAASPAWAWKVKFFIHKIEDFKPAPTLTPDLSI